MKYRGRHAAALTVALIAGFCFIAWMSGYNFDHRGALVGEITFMCSLVCSIPGTIYSVIRFNT